MTSSLTPPAGAPPDFEAEITAIVTHFNLLGDANRQHVRERVTAIRDSAYAAGRAAADEAMKQRIAELEEEHLFDCRRVQKAEEDRDHAQAELAEARQLLAEADAVIAFDAARAALTGAERNSRSLLISIEQYAPFRLAARARHAARREGENNG